MKREDLIKSMKESIGTKEPIDFFDQLTDTVNLLFDRIDVLENSVNILATQSALAIQWDPRLAANLLSKEVQKLRLADKDVWSVEIAALKEAYAADKVTQSYSEFCNFWQDTLGFHPFLD